MGFRELMAESKEVGKLLNMCMTKFPHRLSCTSPQEKTNSETAIKVPDPECSGGRGVRRTEGEFKVKRKNCRTPY